MNRRNRLIALGVGAAVVVGVGAVIMKRSGTVAKCSEDAFRARVVEAARSEVGKRELAKYFADAAPQYIGQSPPPEWCGIFALWCLHQAGLAKSKTWKTGLGFLETSPPLPKTSDPKPGDIAYYTKFQHQAVVLKNNGDGTTENANGNGSGGVVTIGRPQIADAHAFYSIAKLIQEAQAGCK